MLQVGDRVRLTDYVAKSYQSNRKHKVVWAARRGTINRITARGFALVVWDDKKYPDPWDVRALVKV
jgi:hypothetical protein